MLTCILWFVVGCNSSAIPNIDQNATIVPDPLLRITPSSSYSPGQTPQSKATQEVDYEIYKGLQLFPLPDEMKYMGGFLIVQEPKYSIDLIWKDGIYSIWFSKDKVVKDIVILPELEENEIIPAEYCQVDGKIDSFVFTIATIDQEAFENRIVENSLINYAWRADPITERIEQIPTSGIECSGEGGFDPNNIIYKFSK